MTNGFQKIVDFEMCKTCKHKEKGEKELPCSECLAIPGREDSKWPVYYEEKK